MKNKEIKKSLREIEKMEFAGYSKEHGKSKSYAVIEIRDKKEGKKIVISDNSIYKTKSKNPVEWEGHTLINYFLSVGISENLINSGVIEHYKIIEDGILWEVYCLAIDNLFHMVYYEEIIIS